MSVITTVKDKILKNSILARIFASGKDSRTRSCPGQENRETRTRFHPCNKCVKKREKKPQLQNWSVCSNGMLLHPRGSLFRDPGP